MSATMLSLTSNVAAMTFTDGLEFVARTRRQLDRFEVALPHEEGKVIAPEEAREIRQLCDELEADIRKLMARI